MARSLEIPAVVGIHGLCQFLTSGDEILLDGYTGTIIRNPSEETLAEYGRIVSQKEQVSESLALIRETASTTLDGRHIVLSANVDLPEEIDEVAACGAEGIGLYRTEFLYLNRIAPPPEEQGDCPPAMEHVVQTDVDRYVIVEYLAEGGMGAIFLGKKIGMGGFEKEVVLKQLLPEFTSQPEFIDLFLREAKLSAALDHANIVHTIDLVKAGNDYFIVMEYVRGGDLRTILRRIKHRGYQLDPAAAIFIAREVLSALAYAHDKKNADGIPLKLIHRDVSPSNIMVSAAGEVKLADFGIAKASTHKSVFYRVKGKVGYMSPEQAYGDPLDLRSDLYSLAVCLHEMLSGERLFVADLLSTPDQIYSQPIPKLEPQRPDIPRGMDRVMQKALAFAPEDRYQTALEFQDALVKVAYESAMLFSAPDLSGHLRRICGEDPSGWNKEPEEDEEAGGRGRSRGTEVLAEEASAQFSGVELTSIFTGLPDMMGASSASAAEPTRSLKADALGIAYAPTRLSVDLTPGGRDGRAPAFDLSDLRPAPSSEERSDSEELTPDGPRPPAAHRSPEAVRKIDWGRRPAADGRWAGGEVEAEEEAEEDEEDDQDPTMAITDAAAIAHAPRREASLHFAATAPAQPRLETAGHARSRGQGNGPSGVDARGRGERAMEAREAHSRQRIPADEPEDEEPPGPSPAPRRGKHRTLDSVRRKRESGLTDEVRAARRPRAQWLLALIIALTILAAGGAIVAVVGLTGPSLEDPGRPSRRDPFLGELTGSDAGLVRTDPANDLRPGVSPLPDLRAREAGSEPPSDGKGVLKVTSTPARAAVYLDNVFQCETPCSIEELEDGRVYLLSVRRKNYVAWSALIELRRRRKVAVNAFLSEEPDARRVGYLLIRSNPVADVLVDGKEIGRVTSEGRIPLPPGQYEITLSHPHRSTRPRYLISVHAGQTVLMTPRKF
jgi:serine/threonine-protein kinase